METIYEHIHTNDTKPQCVIVFQCMDFDTGNLAKITENTWIFRNLHYIIYQILNDYTHPYIKSGNIIRAHTFKII